MHTALPKMKCQLSGRLSYTQCADDGSWGPRDPQACGFEVERINGWKWWADKSNIYHAPMKLKGEKCDLSTPETS